MKPLVIAVLLLVALAGASLASCTSSTGGSSEDCTSAGGHCVIGNAICAVQGPQNCGPPTPAGLFCCITAVADCGQPGTLTYACAAAGDGGLGCKASTLAFDLPAQDAGDQDASYPVGCTATLPVCNNGHVPQCTCIGQAQWSCVNY